MTVDRGETQIASASLALGRYSGHDLARMPFEIIRSPEALDDPRRLSAFERSKVRDALEVHLRHEPTKVSKSRVARLRESTHPQYDLGQEGAHVGRAVQPDGRALSGWTA
jgi:hypothetical protein